MFKNRYSLAIMALVLWLIGSGIHYFNKSDLETLCKTAQNKLFTQIALADSLKRQCQRQINAPSANFDNVSIMQSFNWHYIGLFVSKNDSLVFWNTAQIPITAPKLNTLNQQGLVHLRNGWYYYNKTQNAETNQSITAFIFIKPDYDLQNNYLRNQFCAWLHLPETAQLDTVSTQTTRSIYTPQKQFLFQVNASSEQFEAGSPQLISALFLLLGFIVLLLALIKWSLGIRLIYFIISWLSLLLIYGLCAYWRFPEFIYSTELFNIRRFANADSWLNAYLGQIIVNSVLVLAFSVVWYKRFAAQQPKRYVLILLNVFFIGFILIWLNQLLKSLITNSTLSFDFLNLFNTTALSYAGIIALILINLSLCVFSISLYNLVRSFWVFIGSVGIIFGLLIYNQKTIDLHVYWGPILLLLIYAIRRFNLPLNALSVGYVLLYLSVCNSSLLSRYIDANNSKNLEVLSFQLTERQDPILESEFARLPEQIKKDVRLRNVISLLPISELETRALIRQKYLGGYFEHYNIELALFDKNCLALFPNSNAVFSNEGFFEDQITYNSQTRITDNLYFIDKYKQNARYVAKVELETTRLYILMEPKQFEEIGSFPDLLLDQSQQKQAKLQAFSYAVYRNNQLTNRFGSFNYPFLKPDSTNLNFETDYSHHVYKTEADTEVIISSPQKNWQYLFTYNSYVFLFFSLITFLTYISYVLVFKPVSGSVSLTQRIQAIVIVLVLLAIVSVAISSTQLIKNQFTADNTKLLQEKSQSVLSDVLPMLQNEQQLSDEQKDLLNLTLKKNARLFSCDVSLFDAKGSLYTTSQPRLYDLGLASVWANPKALQVLNAQRASNFCASDKAGTLQFLSLYTPLYNTQNKLMGYLNLPYFARQNELVSRLSTIVSTLINLYVILFVISILSALVLSGYITKPLRLIKQQIANISLSKRNEPIHWQSNDEIGKLVTEYNGMIAKLEESASRLAKSEREIAWREMAKQVAHEIKNPLTPMKLNLQYLQHIINGNPEDFKEKFQKASASIIEQIDALANIATEFSHFAKLPNAKIEAMDVTELLNLSIETFKNEPGIHFENALPNQALWVNGDKEQALRIFNNVIKNAIQACEESEQKVIRVGYYTDHQKQVISISDTGCGISAEVKPHLFSPNFTTKSTGSGLGLAMVKNSMESIGGSVWYESQLTKGTTFYLAFVRADD